MREDLLRHIWSKQLFYTSRIVTTDGRPVHVLDPGTLSRSSGPDFRNAKMSIQGGILVGDVEFHRTFDDWKLHNHHTDPNYNSVILHVVLTGSAHDTISLSGRLIPTIVLEPFLLSPVESIRDQLSRDEYFSKNIKIACDDRNSEIDAVVIQQWISSLYKERLNEKINRFYHNLCEIIRRHHQTLKEPGPPYHETRETKDVPLPDSGMNNELFKQKLPWEQLLYENLMEGLGYSNNREPMKKLAENIPLMQLLKLCHPNENRSGLTNVENPLSPLQIEAVLFIASGLLPSLIETKDQDSKVYIHILHASWKELSERIGLTPLDRTEWIFSPTRPSNFPTIRIAAASIIVQRILFGSFFRSIIYLIGEKYHSARSKIDQLHLLLESGDHPFWGYHFSFTEASQTKHVLLGDSRKNDLIINIVVPFVCLYAKLFGKNDLMEHSLNIAAEMTLLQDNAVVQTMEKQLIRRKMKIEYAYQQLGLIQLNKKYCMVEQCNSCEIGKLVFR